MTSSYDCAIVGGGAAGLFCAAQAAQQGLRCIVIDHSRELAQRIKISGGGRCNFTNKEVRPEHFISDNPHFVRSALSAYSSNDFIALVQNHGIAFHEKHKGQLFCDHSARDIIQMLLTQCQQGQVTLAHPCQISHYEAGPSDSLRWRLHTTQGPIDARHVVVASGGLAAPKLGASNLAYRWATELNLRLVTPRPALVPLLFQNWNSLSTLAGLSLPIRISTVSPWSPKAKRDKPAPIYFDEDILFTHKGLSGPAILQISSYWDGTAPLQLDICPNQDLATDLKNLTRQSHKQLITELSQRLPNRLAQARLHDLSLDGTQTMPNWRHSDLTRLAQGLQQWAMQPHQVEGWNTAEVTAGGVDTRDVSSKNMQALKHPGMYFIGECLDVTGWLGGYNFQWAWSSAYACAQAMADDPIRAHSS